LLNDLGRGRPEIQPEARSIERWLALCHIAEDGAQVMRIMHGARDLSAIE
jgi:plasmid stabilization system protein ParE